MDAADHSVGDHGRTDGTGRNIVHRYVERRGIRLSSGAPNSYAVIHFFFDKLKLIWFFAHLFVSLQPYYI